MKTKILILLVCIFSFAFQCENDEVQTQEQTDICNCRKMFYENQLVNMGYQMVYTHRGQWELIPTTTANATMLQPSGYYWSSLIGIDANHSYRWECEPN